jgi:thiol-disulfide isomerase/thioredoxin
MTEHAGSFGRAAWIVLLLFVTATSAGGRALRAPTISTPVWINGEAGGPGDLSGKVVLVEFWTFGCVNCLRSVPAVRDLDQKYRDRGLVVVAVHSPEFEQEKDVERVREAVRRLGISYPVAVDNDHRIWRAFDNRAWPAFYLVDRKGSVRLRHVGELHRGTPGWQTLSREIERCLAEEGPHGGP